VLWFFLILRNVQLVPLPHLRAQLDAEVRDMLLEVGEKCSSVVCCRVSPIQKALVVRLVKDNRPVCTAAAGVVRMCPLPAVLISW
jgi:hypothetical protein